MAYDFYAGSSFNFVGTLQLSGDVVGGTSGVNKNQPDFSQWAITAAMYDPSGEINYGAIAVANLSGSDPTTNGLYNLSATGAQTSTWPIGKAQLALKVIAADGSIMFADPIWFRIKASPLN
ncbi:MULTISPECIES: hypothetical protein [Burkholderia cepacia complex]|jgi:hypothetical protein|uniref:Uncharacterized protein n=1 Tax=Burkholderia vietnamiensis TaxID=60552 RepID=A0AAW7T6C9_BURVI|nr:MULTISPECIES: hypothetical protein [Burkholderia cepacia complex]MBU9639580.1 hypothetical protein [Burkholderia multivorans]MDN7798336.1 hypothetical protein [Burkholderia vietnamiensis]DAH52157.1 MAG TPA: hypothetical protein [Caudoviricetes sp.]